MPEKKVLQRARKDAREGKAPSTQAGEFVREEIEHVREGKHGARSAKQAIAIGLSKARRAGVKLCPPEGARVSKRTRKKAARDYATGQTTPAQKTSPKRSRATQAALMREGQEAASHRALSDQADSSAKKTKWRESKALARQAVRTKGQEGLRSAARKAARTRRQT